MVKKIRSTIVLSLILGLIFSCCELHTEVEYKYDNVIIKRIDECGKSMFYYNILGEAKQAGMIWVEYSGINDGFKGYLVFQNNCKVLLLSGDGYFQSIDNDTSTFEYRRIIATERPYLAENVYLIMNSIKYEQELNDTAKTKIIATYNIDKSELY